MPSVAEEVREREREEREKKQEKRWPPLFHSYEERGGGRQKWASAIQTEAAAAAL